jgi:hypothetical protein
LRKPCSTIFERVDRAVRSEAWSTNEAWPRSISPSRNTVDTSSPGPRIVAEVLEKPAVAVFQRLELERRGGEADLIEAHGKEPPAKLAQGRFREVAATVARPLPSHVRVIHHPLVFALVLEAAGQAA